MQCMKKFLTSIDLYGTKIELSLDDNSRIKTKIGGFITIISAIIFIYFFEREAEELFSKNRPFIYSYAGTTKLINSTFDKDLKIPSFFLQSEPNHISELMKYSNIAYELTYYLINSSEIKIKHFFEVCDNETLKNYQEIRYSYISDNTENYCPKGFNKSWLINFDPAHILNYDLKIKIWECKKNSSFCVYNETFYKYLRDENTEFYISSKMLVGSVNFGNYSSPVDSYFDASSINVGNENNVYSLEYDRTDVSTFQGDLFDNEQLMKIVSPSRYEFTTARENYLLAEVDYYPTGNTKIIVREYKTFASALANCFSIFKLFKYTFRIFITFHCKFIQKVTIINKLFDYENSFKLLDSSSNNNKSISQKKVRSIDLSSDNLIYSPRDDKLHINSYLLDYKKNFLEKYDTLKKKNKKRKFHLSFCEKIKIIMCCKKPDKISNYNLSDFRHKKSLNFYLIAMSLVHKYSNLDKILKVEIEFEIIKSLLMKTENNLLFNRMNKIPINNNHPDFEFFSKFVESLTQKKISENFLDNYDIYNLNTENNEDQLNLQLKKLIDLKIKEASIL